MRGVEMKYPVVISRGPTSYGAMVPDLPGVYAVGETAEETRELIAGAIVMHIRARSSPTTSRCRSRRSECS